MQEDVEARSGSTGAINGVEKEPDSSRVQREIRALVANAAADMVVVAIEKAKQGQYQAMKYLFELSGLFEESGKADDAKELSLAKMICRELGLPEECEQDSSRSENSEAGINRGEVSAVE